MDKRRRIRAFHSSWWELNTKAEEAGLNRDWNNLSKAGLFPLIKGLSNTRENENWFNFDASSYLFVASKKGLKSIFLYILILPFINQMELGDKLNRASSCPPLVPALGPFLSSTLTVRNVWPPIVTDSRWMVIGYLSDCLWERNAVCLSVTIIKKNWVCHAFGLPLQRRLGSSRWVEALRASSVAS